MKHAGKVFFGAGALAGVHYANNHYESNKYNKKAATDSMPAMPKTQPLVTSGNPIIPAASTPTVSVSDPVSSFGSSDSVSPLFYYLLFFPNYLMPSLFKPAEKKDEVKTSSAPVKLISGSPPAKVAPASALAAVKPAPTPVSASAAVKPTASASSAAAKPAASAASAPRYSAPSAPSRAPSFGGGGRGR